MRAKHIEDAALVYRGRLWGAIFLFVVSLICAGPVALFVFVVAAAPEPPLLVLTGFCALITLPLLIVLPFQAWAEAVSRVELGAAQFAFVQPDWRGLVPLPPARIVSGAWNSVRAIHRRPVRLRWGWIIPFGYDEYLISTDSGDVTMIEAWRGASSGRPSIPASEIADEVSRRSSVPIRTAPEINRGGFARAILSAPTPWRDA